MAKAQLAGIKHSVTKICLILLILFTASRELELLAQEREWEVKAAFIYNFAKFVEWPSQAFGTSNGLFTIGVVGCGALADALKALEGKPLRSRTITIRQVGQPEEGKKCQMLVISQPEGRQAGLFITATRGQSILTVGDSLENFLALGGMINLVQVDDKIRFEINAKAAQQAGLQISSQLLKLALSVKD